jgi:hypothetical protein
LNASTEAGHGLSSVTCAVVCTETVPFARLKVASTSYDAWNPSELTSRGGCAAAAGP